MWYWQRREQIAYLRETIARETKLILNASDIPPLGPNEESVSADTIRFAYTRNFKREIQVILSSRTTALTYKEVSSVQKIIMHIDTISTDLKLEDRMIMPLSMAQKLCKEFEELSWLKLPEITSNK